MINAFRKMPKKSGRYPWGNPKNYEIERGIKFIKWFYFGEIKEMAWTTFIYLLDEPKKKVNCHY